MFHVREAVVQHRENLALDLLAVEALAHLLLDGGGEHPHEGRDAADGPDDHAESRQHQSGRGRRQRRGERRAALQFTVSLCDAQHDASADERTTDEGGDPGEDHVVHCPPKRTTRVHGWVRRTRGYKLTRFRVGERKRRTSDWQVGAPVVTLFRWRIWVPITVR